MAFGGYNIATSKDSSGNPKFNGYAAFIVNIEGYHSNFERRDSAREDSSNLQTVFNALGFECINPGSQHQNLSLNQWDHRKQNETYRKPVGIGHAENGQCCVRCLIQAKDHSRSNCFVLAISSHGQEYTQTEIIFSDGESLGLKEIFDAVSDENCPSLKGKPRIIILQACRATINNEALVKQQQDHGVPVETVTTNVQPTAVGGASGSDIQDDPQLTGASPNDDYTFQKAVLDTMPTNFLLVYPVVSGQLAQRSEIFGSWLISALKEKLVAKLNDPNHKPINILHLLTDVAGYIAIKESVVYKREKDNETSGKILTDESGKGIVDAERSGVKNAVCFHHRLVQPLIFYPQLDEKVNIPPPNLGHL